MGRPPLTLQRREEILAAMARAIAKYGLAGATMARLAQDLGVHRTLIGHYFGTREALIAALLERQIAKHSEKFLARVDGSSGAARLSGLLDYLFGGPMVASNELVFQGEVYALAGRDAAVAELLARMYRVFLDRVAEELALIFPTTPDTQIATTAYALVCLTEQNCNFSWLGLAQADTEAARLAAKTLLAQLGPVSKRTAIPGTLPA